MGLSLSNRIKNTFLYALLRNSEVKRRGPSEAVAWEKAGRPVPPPHIIKEQVVLEYAKHYGARILVETGTYYGDMVAAMKAHFERIYSIELSPELYRLDVLRFKRDKHVVLINGDSGVELGKIVASQKAPAVFWLDGHYSGANTAKGSKESPIIEELQNVLSQPVNHIVLVDDARDFEVNSSYPSLEKVSQLVATLKPDFNFRVINGIIRIAPADTFSPKY
jgi:hypothetical protein